jgi:PAS domain S-box-containing protein
MDSFRTGFPLPFFVFVPVVLWATFFPAAPAVDLLVFALLPPLVIHCIISLSERNLASPNRSLFVLLLVSYLLAAAWIGFFAGERSVPAAGRLGLTGGDPLEVLAASRDGGKNWEVVWRESTAEWGAEKAAFRRNGAGVRSAAAEGEESWIRVPLELGPVPKTGRLEYTLKDLAVSQNDNETLLALVEVAPYEPAGGLPGGGLIEGGKTIRSWLPRNFRFLHAGFLLAVLVMAGTTPHAVRRSRWTGPLIARLKSSGKRDRETEGTVNPAGAVSAELLENICQGVVILDTSYRFLSINDGALAIFGYPRSSLIGRRVDEYILFDGAEGKIEEAEMLGGSELGRNTLPVRCLCRRGSYVDCLFTFSPLTDVREERIGYIAAITDAGWLEGVAETYGLTAREREIVRHLVRGESYGEMADELCISTATLKTHIHHIYRKTGVKNRLRLVEMARGIPKT